MPVVSTLATRQSEDIIDAENDLIQPEDEKLWLPSDVPLDMWSTGLYKGLAEKEMQLREAEADDALHQVRLALRLGLQTWVLISRSDSSVHSNAHGPRSFQSHPRCRKRQQGEY